MQLGLYGHPLMILVLFLMILNTILWSGLIYRYWRSWKHFKQYETPFVIASISASIITMNCTILIQAIVYSSLQMSYYFLLLVGLAAAFYFLIGALMARHRDSPYTQFVDNLIRIKYKEKQISRTDFLCGRYPDEVLLLVQKHPRTIGYPKHALIGYLLSGLAGALLIPLLTDPHMWVPPIPYYLVPYPPNLLGSLIIILIISLFTTGIFILAEKWPYAGLATILLTILAVTAIIHLPYLLFFQVVILISGICGGCFSLSKQPVKPPPPSETPPELAELVPPKPPLTTAHKIAYIGGGLVLAGAILTIIADILVGFILMLSYPMIALILGIPLQFLILANLWWMISITILGILAVVAAALILRQEWKKGSFLALICGILTCWMIWGIITLIGAIIVLAKYPKNDTQPTE